MEPSSEKNPEQGSKEVSAVVAPYEDSIDNAKPPVPWNIKVLSVIVVSMIGFGGHWSSGVTGALKSTLKKVSQQHMKPHFS